MKRLLFSFVAVGFGFLVVVVSALAVERTQATPSAVTDATESASLAEVIAPSGAEIVPEVVRETEYYLAYPGILPDHPLYSIKMLRDRIRLLFANTPERRFQLQLLYADKRIGAAHVLHHGGKQQLARETAFKAQGYLVQALESADKTGKLEHRNTLASASLKHAQLLENMIETSEDISRLERAAELNQMVQNRVISPVAGVRIERNQESQEELEELEEIFPAEFAR